LPIIPIVGRLARALRGTSASNPLGPATNSMPSAPLRKRPLRALLGFAVLALAGFVLANLTLRLSVKDGPADQPPIVLTPVAAPEQTTTPQPAAPAQPTTPASASPAQLPAGEQRLQLKQLTADDFYDRLQKSFGRPLKLLPADGSPWLRFSADAGDGAPVLIAANRQTRQVSLVGRPEQLRAWRQIVAALDAPPAADRVTQVVATEKNAAPQVRQAANFLMAQAQVQAQAAQPAAGQAPAGAPAAGATAGQEEGLLGPVQIEVVEGTDLVVIRGNPRDVARVMEVIKQIEAMSRVSEPRILVHPLAHVDAQAMAQILQQVFASTAPTGGYSLGPYYGPILSVPLGRPNSILLIGAPSTVQKATELLNQLDAPSKALTQFEVFRLKNSNAEAARDVVERLFTTDPQDQTQPPPLGPKALIIAELRTNALIVRASPSDMADVRALIAEIDRPGGESVNELRVFKLRNSLAADLAPVLQRAVQGDSPTQGEETPAGLARLLQLVTIDAEGRRKLESGVLAGVVVNADTRANALIVSAPPDSMPLLAALIAQLDQAPDATAELKVFTIKNGDAVSLAEMLNALFGTGDQGGGNNNGGGGGSQNSGNPVFQVRFSVDERTNSIIAAGSADELLVVEAILLRLDASEARTRLNRVYKLKNANSLDVAFALQDWLDRKRQVEETAPGVSSPYQQVEREVVVVAEPNSNSLIVSATPSYYQELESIIRQLDEQAPMVMIQVLIGEVRLDDADEFGVELGLQDSVLFDRSLMEDIQYRENTVTQGGGGATVTNQIVQSSQLTPGFNFGNPALGLGNSGSDNSLATAGAVGAQGLSHFAVNRVSDLGFGGFVLAASSESVSMLLRALQESRRLEVLSRPQIMALDNQTGRAFVGEIVPIITYSEINQFSGQPQNYITQEPVGLELLVRPRISPDDLVVMEVYAAKRELGPIDQGVPIAVSPNGDPINVPRINSTEAETTISAVSGQTVVLSGLLTKRDEALHRRVPLLADIPLVGDLFRFDSHRERRTELLIILTPHVIRSRFQSEQIKQVESARMSWCLSDVVDMHGPAGLRSRLDPIGAAEAPAVFPTEQPGPDGQIPGTMIPALAEPLPPGTMSPDLDGPSLTAPPGGPPPIMPTPAPTLPPQTPLLPPQTQ
jgi:type II secretion system protein D